MVVLCDVSRWPLQCLLPSLQPCPEVLVVHNYAACVCFMLCVSMYNSIVTYIYTNMHVCVSANIDQVLHVSGYTYIYVTT